MAWKAFSILCVQQILGCGAICAIAQTDCLVFAQANEPQGENA